MGVRNRKLRFVLSSSIAASFDGFDGEIGNARVCGERAFFMPALIATMIPGRPNRRESMSCGFHFPIATFLVAHPVAIYRRNWLVSETADRLCHREGNSAGPSHRPVPHVFGENSFDVLTHCSVRTGQCD